MHSLLPNDLRHQHKSRQHLLLFHNSSLRNLTFLLVLVFSRRLVICLDLFNVLKDIKSKSLALLTLILAQSLVKQELVVWVCVDEFDELFSVRVQMCIV
jgi:hypothetical protein